MTEPHFKPLTGLRAIAAFMVYLHHYNPGNYLIDSKLLKGLIHEFHVGVTIFFTLSGFLIAHRYLHKVHLSFSSALNYFVNRFSRIYPLYFILTIIALCISLPELGYSRFSFYAFILNLSLLKGLSLEYMPTGIPQAWSLTVEACFYCFAFCFFIILKSKNTYQILIWLFSVLLIPAVGVVIVEACNHLSLPFFENLAFVASYSFFGRSTEFLVGIALAIILKNIKSYGKAPLFTIAGIFLIFLGIYLLSFIKTFYHVNYGTSHPIGVLVNNILLPLGIATLFTGLLNEITWLSKILSSKIFLLLGKSSYAFYLIHISILQSFLLLYFDIKSIHGAAAIFVSLVVLSICLYYFIEEPINKKVNSITRRSKWLTPTSSSNTSALSKTNAQ